MRLSADSSSAAQPPEPVVVRLPITLGQFLKVAGIAGTGGEAKHLISQDEVTVNGGTETRRGRHLFEGDIVAAMDRVVVVAIDPLGTKRALGDGVPSDDADRC